MQTLCSRSTPNTTAGLGSALVGPKGGPRCLQDDRPPKQNNSSVVPTAKAIHSNPNPGFDGSLCLPASSQLDSIPRRRCLYANYVCALAAVLRTKSRNGRLAQAKGEKIIPSYPYCPVPIKICARELAVRPYGSKRVKFIPRTRRICSSWDFPILFIIITAEICNLRMRACSEKDRVLSLVSRICRCLCTPGRAGPSPGTGCT